MGLRTGSMKRVHVDGLDVMASVRALERLLEHGLPRLRGEVSAQKLVLRFAWMPFGGPLTLRFVAHLRTDGTLD